MQKLLISIAVTASVFVTGCSTISSGTSSVSDTFGEVNTWIPRALEHTPLLYKPTIQQGNVVNQEQVNKLKPGMSKRQVRFLLGTPVIDDVFHGNRWDYAYTKGVGSTPTKIEHISLFFADDELTRITGDYRPQPLSEQKPVEKEILVSVPDWVPRERTLVAKALNTVGIETGDDPVIEDEDDSSFWDWMTGLFSFSDDEKEAQ